MVPQTSSIKADELAYLALNAATQLDRFAKGKPTDAASLSRFASAIRDFSGVFNEGGTASYLDPSATEILSNATRAVVERSISNYDTLNEELSSIINSFGENNTHEETAVRLKKFCIEIHNLIYRARYQSIVNEYGVFDYDNSFAS